MTLDEKRRRMTGDPVEGLVLRMAGPTIVIMLISAMYNMADAFFVGRLGTAATAAVGVSFPVMACIQATGFFFGHGAGHYIARTLGARDYANASRMAAVGFFSSLLVGAVIAVAGLALLDPLAAALGSTATILPHARDYLAVLLLGAPWMAAAFTLNNLFRFQGSALYGMVGMTSGAVLNIILDPLFIFGLGMGVRGAAAATALSQLVSFCLLLAGARKGNILRPAPGNFRPTPAAYGEILRGGLPSLCRQGLASVAVVVLNHTAGPFGDAAIAAMAVVQRIGMFAMAGLVGFGQGFQPVCGFNYGAGLYDRVRQALRFCVRTSFWVLLALAAVGFVWAPEIIRLFRDDPEVVRIGALALRLQCLPFPLASWTILNNMFLQTIGRAGRASFLAVIRSGLFLMAFLAVLTPWLGLLGVQLGQPLSDLATFVVSVPLGLGVLRNMDCGRNRERTPGPVVDGWEE